MQNKPKIDTAIPQRRYQLGAYTVVILGDIQTTDEKEYRYVAAVVREGDPDPGLYLSAERILGPRPEGSPAHGGYDLRVTMREGSQVVGRADRASSVEQFSNDALGMIASILDLQDEQPYRLM